MMRSWLAVTFGAIFLVVCLPDLPVLQAAKDPPADSQKGTDHDKKGDDKSHPPNYFKGNLDMTVWSIAVFLLLLTILWKFAWGPIMQGLDKREQTIAQAMEEAKKAQEEARLLRADLQKQREEAGQQARAVVEEARRNTQQMVEEMLAKGRAELQADRERLDREMSIKHDQALADLVKQTSRLATQVASKVIRRELTGDDHQRLVDEALKEMATAARERQRVLTGLS